MRLATEIAETLGAQIAEIRILRSTWRGLET
jgi:hypothetical protein